MKTITESLAASLEAMLTENQHLVSDTTPLPKFCGLISAFAYHFLICNIGRPEYLDAVAEHLNQLDQERTQIWYVKNGRLDYHGVMEEPADDINQTSIAKDDDCSYWIIKRTWTERTKQYFSGFDLDETLLVQWCWLDNAMGFATEQAAEKIANQIKAVSDVKLSVIPHMEKEID